MHTQTCIKSGYDPGQAWYMRPSIYRCAVAHHQPHKCKQASPCPQNTDAWQEVKSCAWSIAITGPNPGRVRPEMKKSMRTCLCKRARLCNHTSMRLQVYIWCLFYVPCGSLVVSGGPCWGRMHCSMGTMVSSLLCFHFVGMLPQLCFFSHDYCL